MAFLLAGRQLARIVCVSALVIGCGEDPGEIELTPFEELRWPEVAPPPSCTPWTGSTGKFALPQLAPLSGLLRMDLSAVLIPSGVAERIVVRVLNEDSSLDSSATGELSLDPLPGMEVLATSPVRDGRGEVTLRFSEPGNYVLSLSLANDLRVGTVEVASYAPRLPIWRLNVDSIAFDDMLDNSHERIKIDGQVEVAGVVHATELRVHGGASRGFPKKSLRFGLDGEGLADGETEVILRAEYNDKSMLRTFLGYELFRSGTLLPTPETEFIHLRVNDRYYGLMHHVDRIDRRFLSNNGLKVDGNLYEADPPSELAVPGGNLSILPAVEDYYRTYQWHAGPGAWEDLIHLIESTLILPDRAFDLVVPGEVDLDSYLAYLAMMAVVQNHEHIRKNFYIYRDPEGDGRWQLFPWDLDLTLGHLWSEVDDVLDERLISDADLFVGEYAPERFGYFNQLADRVLKRPVLRERFLDLVAFMLDHSFTDAFLKARLDYVLCLIEPDLLADKRKRVTNGEYLSRVEELRIFWRDRRTYIETVLRQNGFASTL